MGKRCQKKNKKLRMKRSKSLYQGQRCRKSKRLCAHSNRVCKRRNLRFGKDSSLPSNVCEFRSLQIHHIKHARTALQTFTYLRIPLSPLQDSSMVSTEFGTTQSIPTRAVHAWIQPDRINQHHTAWTAQQATNREWGQWSEVSVAFLRHPAQLSAVNLLLQRYWTSWLYI